MHLAMDDEANGSENFFWDNQPWIFSDNSGENVGLDVLVGTLIGEDQDKGKNMLNSSTSSSPNLLGGDVVVPLVATIGKKRGVSGGSGGGKASASGGAGGEGKGGGESEHEIHIWTERERRKKMRNMFASLHALLPQLPPKADKTTIVDEAVSYIRTLQHTLQKLQKQKLERFYGMSFADQSRLNQPKLALLDTRESFMADQGSSSTLATMNATPIPSPSFPNFPRFPNHCSNFHTWLSPNVILNVCGEHAQINVCTPRKPGMLYMICCILDSHKLEVVSVQVFAENFTNMFMFMARANYTDYQLPEGFFVEQAFKQAAAEIMLWITN